MAKSEPRRPREVTHRGVVLCGYPTGPRPGFGAYFCDEPAALISTDGRGLCRAHVAQALSWSVASDWILLSVPRLREALIEVYGAEAVNRGDLADVLALLLRQGERSG